MSIESQRVLITTAMNRINFGLPIRYANIPFKQPDNGAYGEFFIMGGAEPIALGGAGYGKIIERSVQMIQLTMWVPEGSGTKPATQGLDAFRKAFAYKIGRDSEQCVYHFKGMQELNPSVRDNWSCLIGRIAFTRDEIQNVDIAASIV